MNNPEFLPNDLNFSNLFKKARIHQMDSREMGKLSKSEYVSPRQNISHRTPKFIPKCPYGRSVSVNANRKPQPQPFSQPEQQNSHAGIFSVRTFESKNLPQQMSAQLRTPATQQRSKPKRVLPTTNNIRLFKPDKFQVLKFEPSAPSQVAEQDRRTKIRGLKIRTGSQVKKSNMKLELDHSVVVMGIKLGK